MKYKYSYNKHKIFKNDFISVRNVLSSNYLTQGPTTKKFEKKLAQYVKSKFCISFNSASSALLSACKSLDLKENDYFWTVPNTYLASANAGLICGAKIDFVDINSDTLNICPIKLNKKLLSTKKSKLPKILIVVHFGGCSHEQKTIFNLSRKYGFKIIEDCSHSLGGRYEKFFNGSCKFSDIAITSFHAIKTITTGEGGALFTNDLKIKNFCNSFQENGKIRFKKLSFKDGIYKQYDQVRIGYNLRLSDLNSAIGLSQLKKINKITQKRNKLAKNYIKLLKNTPFKFQKIPSNIFSTYHLFTITAVENKLQSKFKTFLKNIVKSGIGVTLHYHPVHLNTLYKNMGFKKNNFPISENYSKYSISLPIYYDLKLSDQKEIIKRILNCL